MDILLSRWGCYGVCQCRCSTHFLKRFGVAVRSHGCFGRCPKLSLWMSRTSMGRCMCVSTHANIMFAGWSREWAGGWPCGQSPILWGIVCIFSWGMLLSSSICFLFLALLCSFSWRPFTCNEYYMFILCCSKTWQTWHAQHYDLMRLCLDLDMFRLMHLRCISTYTV